MKTAMSVLALAAVSSALPASYVESHEALLWENFKQTYGKKYSGADEAKRRAIFKTNMLKAAEREATSKTGVRHGMNAFSDLTADEFKVYHNLVPKAQPPVADIFTQAELNRAQDGSVDWRTQGRVTQVKNQGSCGSCWAFSTTGCTEGAWSANHSLVSLSEQELVSCSQSAGNDGCNGGWYYLAWDWLLNNTQGGIATEASYPYTSGGGSESPCKLSASMPIGATVTGYTALPHDEDQMAAWVIKNGPISIAVDATSWSSYTGGIMDNCLSIDIDHAVLVVGVTPDYWIVKNSWGSTWGESGYVRLQRGTNQCLMKNYPYAVSV